jgi:hypothetical protein
MPCRAGGQSRFDPIGRTICPQGSHAPTDHRPFRYCIIGIASFSNLGLPSSFGPRVFHKLRQSLSAGRRNAPASSRSGAVGVSGSSFRAVAGELRSAKAGVRQPAEAAGSILEGGHAFVEIHVEFEMKRVQHHPLHPSVDKLPGAGGQSSMLGVSAMAVQVPLPTAIQSKQPGRGRFHLAGFGATISPVI